MKTEKLTVEEILLMFDAEVEKRIAERMPNGDDMKGMFHFFYNIGVADGIVKSITSHEGKPDFKKRYTDFCTHLFGNYIRRMNND